MTVSFVIPLFNCLPLTRAMLASLRATVPAGIPHEIILVDDGSTDGTRDWLQGPQRPVAAGGATVKILLNESNQGFATTCNRGAEAATGEFLFFLNNDLVLLPGWLEPMLDVFARRADAGLVGNVQLNAATGAIDHAGLRFNAKGKPEHITSRGLGAADIRSVIAVTGACVALRRSLWRQLGGFDPLFVNGCEDVDLGLRAIRAGHTNHVACRSVVRHHISASTGRKLRDEENTARLQARWRDVILAAMPRACAGGLLAHAWENPRDHVHSAVVREAALFLAGLRSRSTPRLRRAAAEALALEEARWAELLEGKAQPSVRTVAPAWFPPYQDGASIY